MRWILDQQLGIDFVKFGLFLRIDHKKLLELVQLWPGDVQNLSDRMSSTQLTTKSSYHARIFRKSYLTEVLTAETAKRRRAESMQTLCPGIFLISSLQTSS
jgi:hypothetical protein